MKPPLLTFLCLCILTSCSSPAVKTVVIVDPAKSNVFGWSSNIKAKYTLPIEKLRDYVKSVGASKGIQKGLIW